MLGTLQSCSKKGLRESGGSLTWYALVLALIQLTDYCL